MVGGSIYILITHTAGEKDKLIFSIARDIVEDCQNVAKKLKLYVHHENIGINLPEDNLNVAGFSIAEITFEERIKESLICLIGSGMGLGGFNLPLFKTFADPFNTAGLIFSDMLHEGTAFEVQDTIEHRKAVFANPSESYDLLAYIGMTDRFVVHRVITRVDGKIVAVASTDRLSDVNGLNSGNDTPVAIVRCEGSLPTIGEVTEPYAVPALVVGSNRGSHLGPWMPVSVTDLSIGRFDGPPKIAALGFNLADGYLGLEKDIFADNSFDRAREQANLLTDILRKQGPFEPYRVNLDSSEIQQLPGFAAQTESRWVSIGE